MYNLETIKSMLGDRNVTEVARRTGLSAVTIHRLIKGNNPTYSTMKILSDYFEASNEN